METLNEFLPDIIEMQRRVESTLHQAVLRALARLRVADHVDDDPRPVAEVAQAVGADEQSLRRMLRFAETHRWFRLDGDMVRAETKAALLRRDSPMWASLVHVGSQDAVHRLDHTLRTGGSAFEVEFGRPFWDHLAADAEQEAIFAEAMRNSGLMANLVAVPMIELGDARSVADVGGGTGDLLAAVLRANPGVHGILVDQAGVIAGALPELRDGELSDRATLVEGDLFGPVPTADAYLLARVLHDWPDAQAGAILRGIRAAAQPGARLFDLDLVVPPGDEPHMAKVTDMGMMILFGGAGERTESEFADLFAANGWRLDEVTELPMSSLLRATAADG